MEDRLKAVFENCNDWLRFAEAKNAVILALTGGGIFSAIDLVASIEWPYCLYIYDLLIFATASLLAALFSFAPQTKIQWMGARGTISSSDNLLFFGDIAKYSAKEYLSALYDAVEKAPDSYGRWEIAYADQIVTNARLAARKFEYSRIAVWFLVGALVTPIAGLVLYFLCDPDAGRSWRRPGQARKSSTA